MPQGVGVQVPERPFLPPEAAKIEQENRESGEETENCVLTTFSILLWFAFKPPQPKCGKFIFVEPANRAISAF